jgi:ketosteroid isomerase-like protein
MNARAFAERYLAGTVQRDPELMAEFYAADGVIEFLGRRTVGRRAIAELFGELWTDVDHVEGSLGRVFGGEDGVAFEWSSRATSRSGGETRASGVDVMSISNGKITRSTVYLAAGEASA